MKNFIYILLIAPLFFISSCEEEEEDTQSGYDCISTTCTAVFESPQYLTLTDCESACEEEGPIHGCLDSQACNYNPEATLDNNSCEYALQGYDCDGNISELLFGMEAEGGIVFYVDETGQHGLVASMEDLKGTLEENIEYEWGCYGMDVNGADGTAIGTGYQNTIDIIEDCSQTPIAASEALAYESEGFDDWYLPSRDELALMYNTIGDGGSEGNIGSFENILYSSSSEYSIFNAWVVNFYNGDSDTRSKSTYHRVRVIRAF